MMTEMRTQGISLRRFTGKDVLGATREKIGEVDDVIMNPTTGCAMFAIVDEGGFLGVGERHHVVPWDAFSWTADGQLTLPIDRDKLTGAPVLDRGNMPDWGSETWQRRVYEYYGMPYKGMAGMMHGQSGMSGPGTMPGQGTMGGPGTMGGSGTMGGGSTGGM